MRSPTLTGDAQPLLATPILLTTPPPTPPTRNTTAGPAPRLHRVRAVRASTHPQPHPHTPTALQVSPHDCTGCELCVHACPDHALAITPLEQLIEPQTRNWDFARSLPYM